MSFLSNPRLLHSAVAFASADVFCSMAEKLYDANIYWSDALRNGVAFNILFLTPPPLRACRGLAWVEINF